MPTDAALGSENSSVELRAFSAGLDCRNLVLYDQTIISQNVFIFDAADRDCQVNIHVPVAAGATVYMKTSYIRDCGSTAGLHRHVFL